MFPGDIYLHEFFIPRTQSKMESPLLDGEVVQGRGSRGRSFSVDTQTLRSSQERASEALARARLGTPLEDQGSFGNSHWRWTIVFAIFTFAMALMPVILSLAVPRWALLVCSIVIVALQILFLLIGVLALRNFGKMMKLPVHRTKAGLLAASQRRFKHIVVVPCYLDTIPVLETCLRSLAASQVAEKLLVVMAFEQKAPELQEKVGFVKERFGQSFGMLMFTFHQVDFVREIAGGCSNKNFALHQAFEQIQNDPQGYTYTITTCDTDTIFHSYYFEGLEAVYNDRNPSLDSIEYCVWQTPLFYNWNLDERPFFVRSTGIVRSMMMLGGLISFNLNPMSVFSYPLELGMKVGFINPRYSVDDIIAKVRWMCATNSAVPVKLLPIPCISGPTNGLSFCSEFSEWTKQNGRWMIGAAESFHYFLIHWTGSPFFSGLKWILIFFAYYSVLLCSSAIISLVATIPGLLQDWQISGWPSWFPVEKVSLRLLTVTLMFSLQYVTISIAFFIDHQAKTLLEVKERIHFLRNLFHFLMAPFTLLVYSVFTLFALVEFLFKGKKAAGHNMAAKVGLKAEDRGKDAQKAAAP